MSKITLDDVLKNVDTVGQQFGMTPENLKQAILRWVADEVIGEDLSVFQTEDIDMLARFRAKNDLKADQRKILAQHGYKGSER